MERRRSIRKPFKGTITIDEIYNQESILSSSYDVDVEFFDISREGLGFYCEERLPTDYYFNAKINLGNGSGFYAVIKVIRDMPYGTGFRYGCVFVGLADILALLIDEYGVQPEEGN